MKKRLLILAFFSFCIITSGFATKPESDLHKLSIGVPIDVVKEYFGEPKYSVLKDKKTNSRMLLYEFYKKDGGFAEYHLYFIQDTLYKVMQYVDKKEIRKPVKGDEDFIMDDSGMAILFKDYKIEGKSLVITKIFEDITLSNDQIQDAVITGVTRACNGSQGGFKMKEPSHILYHNIIDKVITFDGRWGSVNVFYTIDVAIKPGRVRVMVSGEEIDWHQDNDKLTYYFSDIYPFATERMKEVTALDSYEFANNTIQFFNQFISVIGEEFKRRTNDDW